MKQYMVDAFTDKVFSGNPAAVCVLERWPDESLMKSIALENNLSETAFVVKEPSGYHLRWFTPKDEINLCGHATLATAFVILNYYDKAADTVEFNTMSGKLAVTRKGDLYEMDFPTYEIKEVPVTDEMEKAFGVRPVKAFLSMDLICVFGNGDEVSAMRPDQGLLEKLPGRIQNASQGALPRSAALRRIRSAARRTARSLTTGQRYSVRRTLWLTRRQPAAARSTAILPETAG